MQFEFYFAKTRAAAHYIHFLTKVYIFSAVIETALSVLYTPVITCRQSPFADAYQTLVVAYDLLIEQQPKGMLFSSGVPHIKRTRRP